MDDKIHVYVPPEISRELQKQWTRMMDAEMATSGESAVVKLPNGTPAAIDLTMFAFYVGMTTNDGDMEKALAFVVEQIDEAIEKIQEYGR